jgi:hypothetical protein
MMRLLLATVIPLLGLALPGLASVTFNGTWVLDLKASDSPEPMLKRMGVSALERKLAGSTKLESTYSQSGDLLTITTRGPAFSRTEHLWQLTSSSLTVTKVNSQRSCECLDKDKEVQIPQPIRNAAISIFPCLAEPDSVASAGAGGD